MRENMRRVEVVNGISNYGRFCHVWIFRHNIKDGMYKSLESNLHSNPSTASMLRLEKCLESVKPVPNFSSLSPAFTSITFDAPKLEKKGENCG